MTITFKDATTQPEKMRPLTYGEDAVFLNPGGIAMLRDALNHRLRELGVEE